MLEGVSKIRVGLIMFCTILVCSCPPTAAQTNPVPAEVGTYIEVWNAVVASSSHQERYAFASQNLLAEPQPSPRLERVRQGILTLQSLEVESRSPARLLAPGAREATVPGPYLMTIESADTVDADILWVTVSFAPAPDRHAVEVGMPVRSARLQWVMTEDGWRLQGTLFFS